MSKIQTRDEESTYYEDEEIYEEEQDKKYEEWETPMDIYYLELLDKFLKGKDEREESK